jgi:hypothetical protein
MLLAMDKLIWGNPVAATGATITMSLSVHAALYKPTLTRGGTPVRPDPALPSGVALIHTPAGVRLFDAATGVAASIAQEVIAKDGLMPAIMRTLQMAGVAAVKRKLPG